METFVKVCMKNDWVSFCKEEDFERLGQAMADKDTIRIDNLFGAEEFIDAGNIAILFISSIETRALFEEFDKMIDSEGEEKEEWEK